MAVGRSRAVRSPGSCGGSGLGARSRRSEVRFAGLSPGVRGRAGALQGWGELGAGVGRGPGWLRGRSGSGSRRRRRSFLGPGNPGVAAASAEAPVRCCRSRRSGEPAEPGRAGPRGSPRDSGLRFPPGGRSRSRGSGVAGRLLDLLGQFLARVLQPGRAGRAGAGGSLDAAGGEGGAGASSGSAPSGGTRWHHWTAAGGSWATSAARVGAQVPRDNVYMAPDAHHGQG